MTELATASVSELVAIQKSTLSRLTDRHVALSELERHTLQALRIAATAELGKREIPVPPDPEAPLSRSALLGELQQRLNTGDLDDKTRAHIETHVARLTAEVSHADHD
jgi:hypothetical protein